MQFKTKWLLILSILVFPSVVYLFFLQGEANFDKPLEYIGPKTDSNYHTIPDFSFLNQFGDTISSDDYMGNVYVANFIFTTCPTICPVMTFHMTRIQQKLKKYPNFKLITHTINPEYDTPKVLFDYTKKMKIDSSLNNWNFVTGPTKDIYKMAKSYFVNATKDEKSPGGFLHSEYFVLVDKDGHVRSRKDDKGNVMGVYDGTSEYEVGLLIDDIKFLMYDHWYTAKKRNDEK